MADKPIYLVRRSRLQQLINTEFNGRQAEFARKVSKPASLIWQVLNGYKGFGETLARQIEAREGLPTGWLDQGLTDDPSEKPEGTQPSEITAALIVHAIQILGKAPADLLEAIIGLALYYEKSPNDCANAIRAIKGFVGEFRLPPKISARRTGPTGALKKKNGHM